MAIKPLLEVKNLSVVFRSKSENFIAVDSISFSLQPGETLGIVGESGSGKSLTALSIMRLLSQDAASGLSGEVLFNSPTTKQTDLLGIPERQIRKLRGKEISIIFQEPMTALNPVFTCGYQVAEVLRLHLKLARKAARLKCYELFKEVQLSDPEIIYGSYPHQLSGGQKQRVLIAMALACNPTLLIADEPTTALDVGIQKEILDLLKRLQKQHGMSMLFISHDLGVIAEMANRVLVMQRGKVVEEATVSAIFQQPQHPYTKGLLACRPPLSKRLKRLPTLADFIPNDTQQIKSDNSPSIAALLETLVEPTQVRESRLKELYAQEPLLQVKDLRSSFPVKKNILAKVSSYVNAVDGVSFDVYPGETLGLVGESGCGKTTLGRSILRLIEPQSGEILFKGKDLRSMSSAEMRDMRKNMQIIFQDPYSSLNPRMSIGSAIMEPLQVHGILHNDQERRKKVIALLERMSMGEVHFNRFPHEFSGGQRQRICIARALVLKPQFIICDESVSALDVSVQAQVLNLLNELKKEYGFTSIFISHDLSVVKSMSDRMMVMQSGKIVEIGEADALYANPSSTYTKALIDAIPKRLEWVDDYKEKLN